jgi:4,5-dihydroxyphthalate decarboxylase
MHTVALKEDLYRDNPSLAVQLYEAYSAAKKLAYRNLDDISCHRITLLWYEKLRNKQRQLLGSDPSPYGIKKNHKTIAALIDYLFEQKLIQKKITVEELFAPNTLTLV